MTPYFTTKKGTGLGLPIVTKIINEHNGNFSIKRNKNNPGTTVLISLPKYAKEILVIDDNPDIRFLVCNIWKSKILKLELLQL